MKQSFKLESIEKTGTIEVANVICELSENQHLDKEIVTVKLKCTCHAVKIMSNHLVFEMKHICEHLNTEKAREFAKDMIKANKTLQKVVTV